MNITIYNGKAWKWKYIIWNSSQRIMTKKKWKNEETEISWEYIMKISGKIISERKKKAMNNMWGRRRRRRDKNDEENNDNEEDWR